MSKNDLPTGIKPGEERVDIQYKLIDEFNKDVLEKFFEERGIVDIEGYIREWYEIPITEELNKHYLVGTNECVLVLFFKKNEIQYEKTIALDFDIFFNACMTRENYELHFVNVDKERKTENQSKDTTH